MIRNTVAVALLSLALTGCETVVPVERKFPEAPAVLLEPAPALKPLPPNTTELSALIENVNDNYAAYRILRDHYEAWQKWYKDQKANFDSVK